MGETASIGRQLAVNGFCDRPETLSVANAGQARAASVAHRLRAHAACRATPRAGRRSYCVVNGDNCDATN
jgi:hypothetical protein